MYPRELRRAEGGVCGPGATAHCLRTAACVGKAVRAAAAERAVSAAAERAAVQRAAADRAAAKRTAATPAPTSPVSKGAGLGALGPGGWMGCLGVRPGRGRRRPHRRCRARRESVYIRCSSPCVAAAVEGGGCRMSVPAPLPGG